VIARFVAARDDRGVGVVGRDGEILGEESGSSPLFVKGSV